MQANSTERAPEFCPLLRNFDSTIAFRQAQAGSDLHETSIATSMQDKIRVLRVLRYVLLHRRTNNVDLEVVFSGPVESSLC
jgi:hypothetical protein